MSKLDQVMFKVAGVPTKYTKIMSNLNKFAAASDDKEKAILAEKIAHDFELQKEAFLGTLGKKLLGYGSKFMGTGFGKGLAAHGKLIKNTGFGKGVGRLGTGIGNAGQQAMRNFNAVRGSTPSTASTWTALKSATSVFGKGTKNAISQLRKTSEIKTAGMADWSQTAKYLAAGAAGAVPFGLAAALGYGALKSEMAEKDQETKGKLDNMQNELSSVGAAADLYALNEMFGQGQGPMQDQGGPYGQGYGPGGGMADGSGMPKDYQNYNPQDFQAKQSSVSGDEHFANLEKVAEASTNRDVFKQQLDNADLSKEAKDLAAEMTSDMEIKLAEALSELLLTKEASFLNRINPETRRRMFAMATKPSKNFGAASSGFAKSKGSLKKLMDSRKISKLPPELGQKKLLV